MNIYQRALLKEDLSKYPPGLKKSDRAAFDKWWKQARNESLVILTGRESKKTLAFFEESKANRENFKDDE